MGSGRYRFVGHQPNAKGVDTVYIEQPHYFTEDAARKSIRRLLYAPQADGTGSIK
jgi:hypothetical protein